jgi:iron complex outermembrane recepter protein
MKTFTLLASASALALGCCGAAFAQTPPATDNQDSATVETVVITAERRSENLMKSPISASVITGDQLSAKNVLKIDDLAFVAPQVTVDNFGQGINFNIRGIGKGEHNTQTMTGVITYRDGTPTFPGYMTEEPYFDVASIEILRGPQGTFVGQNATGGAVFLNTNNPEIGGGYSGYVLANVGNYAEAGAQGAVNIPISDTFAARVAFFADRRDPFFDITENGQKYTKMNDVGWGAMRLSLLWKPNERLSVSFKTDWDYLDNGGYPAGPYYNMCKNYTPATYISATNNSTVVGSPYAVGCNSTTPNPQYTGDPLKQTANDPQWGLDKMTRNVLKIDYEFWGGHTLRSISSYQLGNTMYGTDLDGTDSGNLITYYNTATSSRSKNQLFYDRVGEEIWTQEINIISPSDQRITWILGAFAQSDRYTWTKPWQFVIDVPAGGNAHTDPTVPTNLAQHYKLQGSTPNAAWAVFGQVGVKIWRGIEAQFGGRWSTNRAKNDVDIWQYGTTIQSIQSIKSYSFDYKASLNWSINDNNFVYGFIATGYKPGGLNVPFGNTSTTIPAFGPERVQSYEGGYKGTWFDGHVRAQFDGYYNTYKNFQVSIGYPQYPTFYYEVNSPNATKMYGLEAEIEAVFGRFSFSGGLGWAHSQLGEFWTTDPRAPVNYSTIFGNLPLPCNSKTGPDFQAYQAYFNLYSIPNGWQTMGYGNHTCINLKGHPQTYAPSLTVNLGVEYKFDIGDGDTLTPRVSYAHMGPQWATLFDNRNYGDRLGVRNTVGAQLEWKHGDYVLTGYVSNLTDQHYVAAMNSNLNYAGPPRQYGVRLLKVW